jgi:hypothetical protein
MGAPRPTSSNSTGSTGSTPRDPAAYAEFHGDGVGTLARGVTGSTGSRVDFAAANRGAMRDLGVLLARWLPEGRVVAGEYIARNPRRADRHAGSFRINLRTGRWSDFATGDKGGDPVSLAAFLFNLSQASAARRLIDMLGVH